LERGRLVEIQPDRVLAEHELASGRQDLEEAQASLGRGNFKWSTIQSYYAMFHAGRALIYLRGYREKSHLCLSVALRELYVRAGKMEAELLSEFEDARALREQADYRGSFSQSGAEESIRSAKGFLERAKELIAESS
jgi:uncharacterized protein (UPF0332 family)